MPNIDWDTLGFDISHTGNTMYIATAPQGGPWSDGEYKPYGNIDMSPAAGVINYGQGIFEGLKAYRTPEDRVLLFRPDENAKRFNQGAHRISMVGFPKDRFLEVIHEITRRNADFIPPYGKGDLYIRPIMFGSGPILGLAPAPEYTMIVYCAPVGPYFKKKGQQPIKLIVNTDFHRSAGKGMGNTKYIGNYAGEMYHSQKAKERGYNGCIYLDARNDLMIEEVGAANFFCVKGNRLITPGLGSVLPGITRNSIMHMAADLFNMEVSERNVSIDEALEADECFCTGTAAVIAPIGTINYKGVEHVFNHGKVGDITKTLYEKLTKIQHGEIEDPYGWMCEVKTK